MKRTTRLVAAAGVALLLACTASHEVVPVATAQLGLNAEGTKGTPTASAQVYVLQGASAIIAPSERTVLIQSIGDNSYVSAWRYIPGTPSGNYWSRVLPDTLSTDSLMTVFDGIPLTIEAPINLIRVTPAGSTELEIHSYGQ